MKRWDAGYYMCYGGDALPFAPPLISEKSDLDGLMNVVAEAIVSLSR